MIRAATLDDVSGIEALLLHVKRRTEFVTVMVDFEHARRNIRRCIQSALFSQVAEHNGRITGVFLSAIVQLWYSREKIATDMSFVSLVSGDGQQLLLNCLAWANGRGLRTLITTAVMKKGKAQDYLFAGVGMWRAGACYMSDKPINVPLRAIAR